MDEQHFRLRGHPSEPSRGADSGAEDYVESRGNGRALAYVQHAVLQGDSVVVLTGEQGTGKSVLVDKLLRETGPPNIVPALLAAKRLDVAALLSAVVKAFRAPLSGHSVDELRAGLQAFLATLTASGRRALLVVDDAHQLLPAALRELTELASLRSTRDAPLQIVLAGRPELRSTLQRALLGASAEPVFLFCDVGPLSAAETRAYVEHRFRRARPEGPPDCPADVHQRIHEAAGGVPGAINPLCDRLLATTAERRLARMSPEMIEEATSARASRGRRRSGPRRKKRRVDCRARRARCAAGARRGEARSRPRCVQEPACEGRPLRHGPLVAAIGALAVHVAQGVLAEKRLASLAVATRVAPPSAPAPLKAPVASTAAPLRLLPGVASTAPVAALAPVPPAPPVAESNDWDAGAGPGTRDPDQASRRGPRRRAARAGAGPGCSTVQRRCDCARPLHPGAEPVRRIRAALRRGLCAAACGIAAVALAQAPSTAGADRPASGSPGRSSNVPFKIVTASERGTYIQIGRDLARFVAPEAGIDLEVLPSAGSAENVQRLRREAGVKLALVQSDVYQAFLDQAQAGNAEARELIRPLRLIVPLYNEEIYFIVRADAPQNFVHEIRNARINVGPLLSGTAMTATTLYRQLFGAALPRPAPAS
jgi:type II secretory pathway predicted ATPase ExeA